MPQISHTGTSPTFRGSMVVDHGIPMLTSAKDDSASQTAGRPGRPGGKERAKRSQCPAHALLGSWGVNTVKPGGSGGLQGFGEGAGFRSDAPGDLSGL